MVDYSARQTTGIGKAYGMDEVRLGGERRGGRGGGGARGGGGVARHGARAASDSMAEGKHRRRVSLFGGRSRKNSHDPDRTDETQGSFMRRTFGKPIRSSRAALGSGVNFLFRGGARRQYEERQESTLPKDFQIGRAENHLGGADPLVLDDRLPEPVENEEETKAASEEQPPLESMEESRPKIVNSLSGKAGTDSDDEFMSAMSMPFSSTSSARMPKKAVKSLSSQRRAPTSIRARGAEGRIDAINMLAKPELSGESYEQSSALAAPLSGRLFEYGDVPHGEHPPQEIDGSFGDIAKDDSAQTTPHTCEATKFHSQSIDERHLGGLRRQSYRSGDLAEYASTRSFLRPATLTRANMKAMFGMASAQAGHSVNSRVLRQNAGAHEAVDGKISRHSSQPVTSLIGKSELVDEEQFMTLLSQLPDKYLHCDVFQVYSTNRHSQTLKTFYKSVSKTPQTIMLIKDSSDYVFGAFCSHLWQPQNKWYGDGESFLFTMLPNFKVHPWTRLNLFFQFSNNSSLGVGGGFDCDFGIFLDADLRRGSSNFCETYSSECLASDTDFDCAELEVWGINVRKQRS